MVQKTQKIKYMNIKKIKLKSGFNFFSFRHYKHINLTISKQYFQTCE